MANGTEKQDEQKQKQIANIMRDKINIAPISQWIDSLPDTTVGKDSMKNYMKFLQNTNKLQNYLEQGNNTEIASKKSNFLQMKWKEWKATQHAASLLGTAPMAGVSLSSAAGSGQPPLTSYGFGAKGGKRNTKKRSNKKKKKTKKHKKKQHRKTKRG